MDTALYFPYVRVPQTPWFTQVLLYWDRAATIIPHSLLNQRDYLNPYMRELVKERLLEPVRPDLELHKRHQAFDSAFLRLIGPQVAAQRELRFTTVHADKLTTSLFGELSRRGLAKSEGYSAWWQVEVTTAGIYMAYLACAISGIRSEASKPTLPVTDQEQAIATLAADSAYLKSQLAQLRHAADPTGLNRQLARLRYAAITQALPAPSGPVPAVKLRAFKEDNSEKLRRCRIFLDDKLADLAAVTDPELRRVKAAQIMQELEDDVKSLQELMNKRRWPAVALIGFGGVMGAALATAVTLATGGGALAVGFGVGAGVLQTGGAGYAAVELMKRPRYNARAPLAYAALAGRL